AEVFDRMLVPALSRAGRDAALGELDESNTSFILRVIGEILDDLEGTADLSLSTNPRSGDGDPDQANGKVVSPQFKVAGVAAIGSADALTLRMLGQMLAPS